MGWVSTDVELPTEGVVVETRSPSGILQQLVRHRRLWFHPDMSMYVYYVPEAWWRPDPKDNPY